VTRTLPAVLPPLRPLLTRAALVVTGALAATLAFAAPAAAHGADAPDGTNYRTEVTGVTPARPGLTVRAVEAGARLELVNRTGRNVEVIGYSGEPYLRVGPDGVFENTRSPSTYLNRTIAGDATLPPEADPAAAPSWRQVSDSPTVRWHDQRALWAESAPPAQVSADPAREQRVRDWAVPVRDDTATMEIRGTLDWVPPPDAYPWWAAVALGFLAVGAAGLLPAGTVAGVRALRAVGALFAGLTNAAVFARSVAPVPWPALYARILVALVLVAGAGAVAAGVLRLHAAARTPVAEPTSPPSVPVPHP
jgi:hypothetical protein